MLTLKCDVCGGEREYQDRWCEVVTRNLRIIPACIICWTLWPDPWKKGLKDDIYDRVV